MPFKDMVSSTASDYAPDLPKMLGTNALGAVTLNPHIAAQGEAYRAKQNDALSPGIKTVDLKTKNFDYTPPTAKEWFLKSRNTAWAEPGGGVIPFYPQQRYIDKNLAPELGITAMQIEASAQANQLARKNGLMSPKLADMMLPVLLTEGASGVRGWGFPDTPHYRNILQKAGLPQTVKEIQQLDNRNDYDRELVNQKLMHAKMAAFASIHGDDKALERWNGVGKSYKGKYLYADAENHYRKVMETAQLLQHPKNTQMKNAWEAYSARHAAGPIDVVTENQNPDMSGSEYGQIGDAINAVAAAPADILHSIRQIVRQKTSG